MSKINHPLNEDTSVPITAGLNSVSTLEGADFPPASKLPAGPRKALRRTTDPPRNQDAQIYCDHIDCRDKTKVFRRICEWNKHMDQHERPYRCREAGCELNPGFTYSGGLLRHQREVHKMHLGAKQPLFCPFPNCNRSSGNGFTRRENLEEHKRRRHLDKSTKSPSTASHRATPALPTVERPSKRLRVPKSSDHSTEAPEIVLMASQSDVSYDESPLVVQLRQQLLEKDRAIQQLRDYISHPRRLETISNNPYGDHQIPKNIIFDITLMRTGKPSAA